VSVEAPEFVLAHTTGPEATALQLQEPYVTRA
jgi:hypothetical protein